MSQTLFALVVFAMGPAIRMAAAGQGGAAGTAAPPPTPRPHRRRRPRPHADARTRAAPAPAASTRARAATPAPPPAQPDAARRPRRDKHRRRREPRAAPASSPTAPRSAAATLHHRQAGRGADRRRPAAPPTNGSSTSTATSEAPLRISFGPPSPANLPTTHPTRTHRADVPPYPPGAEPPVAGHAVAQPDARARLHYQDWDFTNTVHGPWTQLNFSYGNSRAMATVIVDSYAVHDGGYSTCRRSRGSTRRS